MNSLDERAYTDAIQGFDFADSDGRKPGSQQWARELIAAYETAKEPSESDAASIEQIDSLTSLVKRINGGTGYEDGWRNGFRCGSANNSVPIIDLEKGAWAIERVVNHPGDNYLEMAEACARAWRLPIKEE